MKQKLLLTLLTAGLLLINACKKESAPNNFDKLTNGDSRSWKLTSLVEADGTDRSYSCLTDNVVTFSRSGTFMYYVTENKCSSREEDYTGKWTLDGNETLLVMYYDQLGGNDNSLISELTDSKLVVVSSDGDVMTFTAQ